MVGSARIICRGCQSRRRIAGIATLGGALGSQRDPYADGAWNRTTTFWASTAVGPVSVAVRLADRPGEAQPVLGVAAAYTARPRSR